jgi:hypothetical protein
LRYSSVSINIIVALKIYISFQEYNQVHAEMTLAGSILLKEIKNGLQTANARDDILKWIAVLRAVLCPQYLYDDPDKLLVFGYDRSTIQAVTKEDLQMQLKRILEILISRFSVEWISTLTNETFSACVKPLFYEVPRKDTLYVLSKAVTEPKRY